MSRGGEGVDVCGAFVASDGFDAREAEGETGVVALGGIDGVESDFEDDGGFDPVHAALGFEGGALEVFGEVFDFFVGEAGIGFADGDEFVGAFVADGEGVVGEDFGAASVALLSGDDDAVEGGHHAFELEPGFSAPARGVGRVWFFGDKAFVAGGERVFEVLFDFFDGVGLVVVDEGKGSGEGEFFESLSSLVVRLFEEVFAFLPEDVEGDEVNGDGFAKEEVALMALAAEALLEVEEVELSSFGKGDEFAVEDAGGGK